MGILILVDTNEAFSDKNSLLEANDTLIEWHLVSKSILDALRQTVSLFWFEDFEQNVGWINGTLRMLVSGILGFEFNGTEKHKLLVRHHCLDCVCGFPYLFCVLLVFSSENIFKSALLLDYFRNIQQISSFQSCVLLLLIYDKIIFKICTLLNYLGICSYQLSSI